MTIGTFDPKTAVITMTEAAAAHVRRQLTSASRDAVRLSVTESGCSGYMYQLDYTDAADATDLVCEVAPDVRVYVAADAVGARGAIDHEIALRRMDSSGATLTTVEAALFEWCGRAGSPEFKQISQLVRESPPP